MIDPNRNTSEDILQRLREASYERFRLQLLQAIEILLDDFDLAWDDIIYDPMLRGDNGTREYIGTKDLTLSELNDIAAVFSAEPYIIFRPRAPWVKS